MLFFRLVFALCFLFSLLLCAPGQVREYLEKNWKETSGRDTLALAVRALMEVVEAGSKNLEIALMEAGTGEGNLCSLPLCPFPKAAGLALCLGA